MTKPPSIATLAGVALALLTGGCGGSGSTHHSPTTAARPVAPTANASTSTAQSPGSQQGAHAFAPSPLSPVPARAASPPATVLRRYALLYGNLCSCSRAAETLDELATLATPGLAAQLRRAALSARAAVARGLPEPARAVGAIANLELAPAHGSTQTGLVVLVERTAIAHQGTTAPTPVAYTARLALTPGGWRVASFQPVPLAH
ncbi:MAG: hypothetical protein ACLP50_22720 [Solirubrobacteraceae bacterium]